MIAESHRKSLLASLGPAIIGLVGVALGAGTAAYIQFLGQKQAMVVAQMQETTRGYRDSSERLSASATDYLDRLARFARLDTSQASDRKRLTAELQELQKSAFELSLRTSLPASMKILVGTDAAARVADAAMNGQSTVEPRKECVRAVAEGYVAVYAEVAQYRIGSVPDGAKGEAIRALMQLLLSGPTAEQKK